MYYMLFKWTCFVHSFNIGTKNLKSAYVFIFFFLDVSISKWWMIPIMHLQLIFLCLPFLPLLPPFFFFFLSKCYFLDSILKCRDITRLTKVHLVKATVFPVVLYGCKSWTIKKAEHQRMDAWNCGIGEDSRESLGQQGDLTSSS